MDSRLAKWQAPDSRCTDGDKILGTFLKFKFVLMGSRLSALTEVELQWGRARKNAETVRQAGHHRHNGRFNGAALGRTRKRYVRQDTTATMAASMGPRSEERGNSTT